MTTNHSDPVQYPLFGIMNFGKNYSVFESSKKIHKDGNVITACTFYESYNNREQAKNYVDALVDYQKNLDRK